MSQVARQLLTIGQAVPKMNQSHEGEWERRNLQHTVTHRVAATDELEDWAHAEEGGRGGREEEEEERLDHLQ